MKVKFTILASVVIMLTTACASGQMVGGANVSVFAQIPMAPNVVLTVETPIFASPGPSYIWINGHWTWDWRIGGYVWVQGFWAMVPFPGAMWIPGYWESFRGGFRWVDARWWPRNQQFTFGFQNNRFDWFGRPVYFPRPRTTGRAGYAFTYDNRPETRGRGFSSSPTFNDAPRSERTRLTREFERQTNNSVRPAGTNRNTQDVIRIRENENQRVTRESTPATRQPNTQVTRETTPATRQSNIQENQMPATTAPSRVQPNTQENRTAPATTPGRVQQPDNSRQNTESRSAPSYEGGRERNGSSSQTHSRGADSGSNSRASGGGRSR